MTTLDYPDYGTAQQHADRIAATGAPLLALATNILNDQLRNVPANASTTVVSNLPVTQIGYQLFLQLLSPGGTALPWATVDMLWKDSLTGVTIAHETWTLGAGSTSGGSIYLGTGPTKGDRLTITVFNNDLASAMTLTTVLHQNSRIYLRDDWRQETINTIPGVTGGTHNQQGNCLVAFSGSINAGTTLARYVSLYAGRVLVSALGFGQVGNIFVDTLDAAINLGGVQQGPGNIYGAALPASGLTVEGSVTFPRAPTLVRIVNTSGVASNYDLGIYIDEYLS